MRWTVLSASCAAACLIAPLLAGERREPLYRQSARAVLRREQQIALLDQRPADPSSRAVWDLYDRLFRQGRQLSTRLERIPQMRRCFGPGPLQAIRRQLQTGRPRAARAGAAVLDAFSGGWRGRWHQPDGLWVDHLWEPPVPLAGDSQLLIQHITMGRWDPVARRRRESFPAINAINTRTGVILGAVGLKDGRVERPHVGYRVDARTLIWLALDGEEPGLARYSLFHEQVAGGRYRIRGVSFTWDCRSGRILRRTLREMWGEYSPS